LKLIKKMPHKGCRWEFATYGCLCIIALFLLMVYLHDNYVVIII